MKWTRISYLSDGADTDITLSAPSMDIHLHPYNVSNVLQYIFLLISIGKAYMMEIVGIAVLVMVITNMVSRQSNNKT
jgi:hypothetical protein